MTRSRMGLSFPEVIVAVLLFAACLVPLTRLLSSSLRTSGASAYEVMAVHYAEELVDQLRGLSPHLKTVFVNTGGKTLFVLLRELSATGIFQKTSGRSEVEVAKLPGTDFALFVTPLDPHFLDREVTVRQIDDGSSGSSV